jgi:hypothetical protein
VGGIRGRGWGGVRRGKLDGQKVMWEVGRGEQEVTLGTGNAVIVGKACMVVGGALVLQGGGESQAPWVTGCGQGHTWGLGLSPGIMGSGQSQATRVTHIPSPPPQDTDSDPAASAWDRYAAEEYDFLVAEEAMAEDDDDHDEGLDDDVQQGWVGRVGPGWVWPVSSQLRPPPRALPIFPIPRPFPPTFTQAPPLTQQPHPLLPRPCPSNPGPAHHFSGPAHYHLPTELNHAHSYVLHPPSQALPTLTMALPTPGPTP